VNPAAARYPRKRRYHLKIDRGKEGERNMKKALAIFLALMMILSYAALAACDSATTDSSSSNTGTGADANNTPANTDTTPANTDSDANTPAASGRPDDFSDGRIQRMLDNGEEVLIGMAPFMLSEFFLSVCEGMKAQYAELGITLDYSNADGDFNTMLTLVENYVTMGAVQVILTPDTVSTFGDFAERVEAQGVQVVLIGVSPDENFSITSIANVDHYGLGERCAKMAVAWLDVAYPDAAPESVHVCLLAGQGDGELLTRQEAMINVMEADPRTKITFVSDATTTMDDGYVGAQNALMTDPDIVLFLGFAIDSAIGASNYVMAQPGLDFSKYGSFGVGLSDTAMNYVDLSETNESILRGLINASNPEGNPWDMWFDASYNVLFGIEDPPLFTPAAMMTYNTVDFDMY